MTLVVVDAQEMSQALWASMKANTLEAAKRDLAKREGIDEPNIRYGIGWWDRASNRRYGRCSGRVAEWGDQKGIDAVVWTNLKPGFRTERGIVPTYIEVLAHFRSLNSEEFSLAEEYVRRAPAQVSTPYRKALEGDLGWHFIRS